MIQSAALFFFTLAIVVVKKIFSSFKNDQKVKCSNFIYHILFSHVFMCLGWLTMGGGHLEFILCTAEGKVFYFEIEGRVYKCFCVLVLADVL